MSRLTMTEYALVNQDTDEAYTGGPILTSSLTPAEYARVNAGRVFACRRVTIHGEPVEDWQTVENDRHDAQPDDARKVQA